MRTPRNAWAWGGVLLLPAVGTALYGFARGALFRRATRRGVSAVGELLPSQRRRPRARPAAASKRSSSGRGSAKGRVARRGEGTRDHASGSALPARADPGDSTPTEQLAFHARLGKVLDVVVGVHANAHDAELDVQGIDAHTELRIRPSDLEALVARAAALLDRERAN
jgi:hypothetical protein